MNGKQMKEFADFVIIGHSERRQNFKETDEMLVKKVQMVQKYLLTPIFCIQNEDTFIPEGVKIVAYEPVEAIGTGNPDTPENAEKVARVIKNTHKDVMYVLYGGSVTSANISGFTKMPSIDGALVGGASLDAKEFTKIIQNA
ncbi:MAG: triosephosphate isomerase [Candidatus Levybacteria bacterium]|nr:triosephosphate isomerase [Candidatus Levybacteria bacterium]